MRSLSLLLASSFLVGSLGCSKASSEPTPDPSPTPVKSAPTPSQPLVLAQGIRFVKADPGEDVPKIVRAERDAVRKDGRDLVVYVGAKWCEPCQKFHQAAVRGDLDTEFPQLSILEFDADEDRERLLFAGYSSKYIPLFVYPNDDGKGSEQRRFEGGVKGEGAVASITPRLKVLLQK